MLFPPSVMVQEERGWMATNAVKEEEEEEETEGEEEEGM